MREIRSYGSVGVPGGRPPGSTRIPRSTDPVQEPGKDAGLLNLRSAVLSVLLWEGCRSPMGAARREHVQDSQGCGTPSPRRKAPGAPRPPHSVSPHHLGEVEQGQGAHQVVVEVDAVGGLQRLGAEVRQVLAVAAGERLDGDRQIAARAF